MKATNLRPPRPNGSAQVDARGAARKRSTTKPKTVDSPTVAATAGPQDLAGFAPANVHPVDAEMWPVQPVIWLQPEWKPGLPASSGLSIERHHKIPVPGFLNVAPGRGYPLICSTGGLAAGLSSAPSALLPKVRLTCPESGLTLLGWDPRTVVPPGQASLTGKSQFGTTLVGQAVPPVKPAEGRPHADQFPTEGEE
jgi:hypothetical protein